MWQIEAGTCRAMNDDVKDLMAVTWTTGWNIPEAECEASCLLMESCVAFESNDVNRCLLFSSSQSEDIPSGFASIKDVFPHDNFSGTNPRCSQKMQRNVFCFF